MYKPRSPGGDLLKELERPKDGIYLITGHGSDDPGVEKKIPKGCKYCTFAECGLRTSSEDPRIIHIENEFMKGNPIFEKPTFVNKFLHTISKKYKNNINKNIMIKGTKSSISIKNYSKTFKKIPKSYTAERARHTYTLSTYSLFAYNQTYGINEFINDIKHVKDITKKYITDLFDKLEYVVEYSGIIKFTEEPREPNKKHTYKIFDSDDIDYFYDLFQDYIKKSNIQNVGIYTLINDMLYRENRNVDLTPIIKESFKYSFFPPVEDVLEFYENHLQKTRFNNILDFKYHFNRQFDITQQDLFYYLPGTYYNFICRNVEDEDEAMMRRQLSPMNPLTRKRKNLNYRPNHRLLNSLSSSVSPVSPKSPKSKPLKKIN